MNYISRMPALNVGQVRLDLSEGQVCWYRPIERFSLRHCTTDHLGTTASSSRQLECDMTNLLSKACTYLVTVQTL